MSRKRKYVNTETGLVVVWDWGLEGKMTANGNEGSWGWHKVLKLDYSVPLCKYTKVYWIVHLERMNWIEGYYTSKKKKEEKNFTG
jgi:hypothetical protein